MASERGSGDEARVPSPSAETRSDSATVEGARHETGMSSAQAGAGTSEQRDDAETASNPPLPDEEAPPLPDEPPPDDADDGWEPRWDTAADTWYFFNHKTGVSQWQNPRVPAAIAQTHIPIPSSGAPGLTTSSGAPGTASPPRRRWGGYNPAIHGSYDPNADYAQEASREEEEEEAAAAVFSAGGGQDYTTTAHFNRFSGKQQQVGMGPEMHNDENKSKRQMNAFFDVDAAANSHDGRSLKAERRGKTLSKKELKAYKEKRRDKKEEKRRAWLLD